MVRRSSLAVLAVVFAVGAVRVEAGQTAYAQGNFFLAKNQLSAVNYRAGTMLPVGTKVDVVKVADDSVRCKTYLRTGHGGNARLQALLADDPARARAFQLTILRTLPLSMAQREVVAVKAAFKRKLGSRAFGLNGN